MKKKILIIIVVLLIIICVGLYIGLITTNNGSNNNSNSNSNVSNSNELKELPKPEVTGGQRGELGIDKNINEQNIDEYLNREDSVYRDMRMLEDPATYENIGGDRYLSGYIKGFEITPLPYIIPVDGLPKEVGETYNGTTLFTLVDGKYVPNYEESMSIIEKIFPKDKVIFLMCGGGGYAGMTKNFLVSLGWDQDKIYNVGGYWYYEGKNNVEVKKIVDNKVVYDFDNVPYNKIEFDKLTKIDKRVELSGEFYNYNSNNVPKNSIMEKWNKIDVRDGYWPGVDKSYYDKSCSESSASDCLSEPEINAKEDKDRNTAIKMRADIINDLLAQKKSFVAVVSKAETCMTFGDGSKDLYTNAITYFNGKKIFYFDMGTKVFKETNLYKTVKYFPTVIIVKDGEIYKYTDPNKNEYLPLDKDDKKMAEWLEENIVIK